MFDLLCIMFVYKLFAAIVMYLVYFVIYSYISPDWMYVQGISVPIAAGR